MSVSKEHIFGSEEKDLNKPNGFIGKALIEKIVRSFPDFGKIYILMRNKKGQTVEERLHNLFKNVLYARAWKEQPQNFQRIYGIEGDCKSLGLGISPDNLERLKNVTMIFHSAASVRFDDPLKDAVLLNTRGTHELVKIAETLPKLKAFIYISTAFSNPNVKPVVEEKVYPAYADWRTTIKLAEKYDEEILDILFPKYSINQPNTYTFTKSLGEQIVNDYRHKIPCMLYRPSIVICTIEDPVPGWLDNFNGPIGMLVACGTGVMRTNYADPNIMGDFIPIDVTVQGLIVAGYKVAMRGRPALPDEPLEVVNCASSTTRSLTYGELINIGKKIVRENPFENCLWLPEGSITRCPFWHYLRFFSIQIVLTIIVDTVLRMTNKKPFLLKIQRRIHKASQALFEFTTHEWFFINDNFMAFEKLIPPEDSYKLRMFTYTKIDNYTILRNSLKGAKQFLLNEPTEASNAARWRLRIFLILHYTIEVIAIYYLGRFLIRYTYQKIAHDL